MAQDRLIICTTEQNTDRSVSIYAESMAYGEYTLQISFSSLVGYKANNVYNNVAMVSISRGKREVVKLVPDNNASSYAFNYRYIYFAGTTLRKPPSDTVFKYLFPATKDNVIRISNVSSIEDRLGRKPGTEYFGIGFIYGAGDTVCAARAGTVYELSDEVKTGEKGMEVFRSNRNRINIQQRDGTLAHYIFRAPIQLLVAGGDNVIPGQPIAVFNKESERYEVMFNVNYLDEKIVMGDNSNSISGAPPVYYRNLPTHFCVSEDGKTGSVFLTNQTFSVTHPKEIIGAELSKKEKKKIGLQ
jgi:hypothetical protein